jgi:hypothetical protein
MGVIFSTINPDDFSTNIKNLNPQFKRLSKKDRSIAKQAWLEEQHRKHLGYLFTHKCSNKNCTETIDFIYETVTSEEHAKLDAGWVYFLKVKLWFCAKCSDIQKVRDSITRGYSARQKANATKKIGK